MLTDTQKQQQQSHTTSSSSQQRRNRPLPPCRPCVQQWWVCVMLPSVALTCCYTRTCGMSKHPVKAWLNLDIPGVITPQPGIAFEKCLRLRSLLDTPELLGFSVLQFIPDSLGYRGKYKIQGWQKLTNRGSTRQADIAFGKMRHKSCRIAAELVHLTVFQSVPIPLSYRRTSTATDRRTFAFGSVACFCGPP